EVNAPANRGDLLGHLGGPRELVAILRGKLVLPDADLSPHIPGGSPRVELPTAPGEDGPASVAPMIAGLHVGPSPRRIAQRLRSVGVRPISNLVDVTNYVMSELGQPLHAFDADKLTSGVVGISRAANGEKFKTLDNVDRTLVDTDLMIRDG